MAARWRWIVLAVLPAVVLLACSRDAAPPRAVTNDDLRAMALRVEDLPPGFTLADEKLTTNQEFADQTNDPPTVRGLLDGWGRDTELQTVFTVAGAGDRPRQPVLIAGSADHFADDQHARQAFAGQRDMLKYAKTPFVGRSTFQAPHLGDQAAGLRMYTTDEHGTELVVYWIVFRDGPIVADVTTASLKHQDYRGAHAVRLARLVEERVDGRLKAP